jgi:hypothetical protein
VELDNATGAAWQQTNDQTRAGRGGSTEEAFAREIALVFLDHGLEPEPRGGGGYCFALALSFEAMKAETGIDLAPADLPGLARRALGRMRRNRQEKA